ncbi:MAG: hypothetical protein OHK005_19780 [Candidatus Methylacidiphilales bacterium]
MTQGPFERAEGGVWAGGKCRAKEMESVFRMKRGQEEGKTLDVIPVEVAEQEGGLKGFWAAEKVEAEKAQAGSGIEDQEQLF